MFEYGLLSLVYRIIGDVWSAIRGKQRRLSTHEIVQLRQKWKNEFETQLLERRQAGLRSDVIVRDMRRLDNYPNTGDKGKGISPWFRVGLMGTYHKGIQVGLRWGTLTMDQERNKWRYTDYQKGEKGDIKVILIGYVPYENIEAVDWDGDEFYGFPHIYCYFSTKRKEPYERLAFCEEKRLNDFPFYSEVADYDAVHKMRKRAGVDYFA